MGGTLRSILEHARRELSDLHRLGINLGAGGGGRVFLADDLRHGRKVASRSSISNWSPRLATKRWHPRSGGLRATDAQNETSGQPFQPWRIQILTLGYPLGASWQALIVAAGLEWRVRAYRSTRTPNRSLLLKFVTLELQAPARDQSSARRDPD